MRSSSAGRSSSTATVTTLALGATVWLATGCGGNAAAPTTRPARLADRTDRALNDPFGYSPDFNRTDISGGDIKTFDKDGMNRDVDHVLNP